MRIAVLEGYNAFWTFVVTMLLNVKSLLIATKLLVFFFALKSINNLLHQMIFWVLYMYNVLTKWNILAGG